jgi:hypothetical protein
MSLYNMVCGNNPLYKLFHQILETEAKLPEIPRWRDTYTTKSNNGELRIVIYTRTGGGNRDEHREENKALRNHPLCLGDADDSFDSTFNNFFFSIPAAFLDSLSRLHDIFSKCSKGMTPRQKFENSLSSLNDSEPPYKHVDLTESEIEEMQKTIDEINVLIGKQT